MAEKHETSLLSLERLPAEIIATIAQNLQTTDLKQLRLSCRNIALLTHCLLALEHFHGLPWRNDAGRLNELSKMNDCAGRIRAVTFNFGRLNEYKVLHASFSHRFLLEPDFRIDLMRQKWENFYNTKTLAKAAGPFRLELVGPALGRLTSLRHLSLTWMRCPWEDEEPMRLFSGDVSVRLAKGSVLEVQQAVLSELWRLGVRLESLAVEPLQLGEVELPIREPGPACDFFNSLRKLSVVVKRKAGVVLQEELGLVLSRTPALKQLRLQFLPPKNLLPDEYDFLPTTHLPHLESFELVGAEIDLNSFATFLTRHAGSIKKLHLGRCKALSGDDEDSVTVDVKGMSWDGIFKLIRSRFARLEDVRLEGTFVQPDGSALVLIRDDGLVFGQEMGNDVHIASAMPLERYLLDGGEYPDLWADLAD